MKVTYKTHMGDDLNVVNVAKVSFNKEAAAMDNKGERLLSYLAKHDHWSPFAHPQVQLHIKAPIFVARQDFKHIVGFVRNEVSRRYVSDAPEFYRPEGWRSMPEGSIKQGSGGPHENQELMEEIAREGGYSSCDTYEALLMEGVCPEQARMVLPQSMYTEYITTGSLAAWARAYNQRTHPHAQKEIRDLYEQVGTIMEELFPVSWKVLTGVDV